MRGFYFGGEINFTMHILQYPHFDLKVCPDQSMLKCFSYVRSAELCDCLKGF